MIALNDEARRSMVQTLDALQQWSNEIHAANDHCLTKVRLRSGRWAGLTMPPPLLARATRAQCTISYFSLSCATPCKRLVNGRPT